MNVTKLDKELRILHTNRKSLLKDHKLTPMDFSVLVDLVELQSTPIAHKHLSEALHANLDTVRRCIYKMQKLGLVTVVPEKASANRYLVSRDIVTTPDLTHANKARLANLGIPVQLGGFYHG